MAGLRVARQAEEASILGALIASAPDRQEHFKASLAAHGLQLPTYIDHVKLYKRYICKNIGDPDGRHGR